MAPLTHPHIISTPHVQQPPAQSGFAYGQIFRVNFWAKMTMALGFTQITIGVCCVMFYLLAYLTDHRAGHLVRYVGVGLANGTVIISAGTMALLLIRKKTRFLVTCFLLLSLVAAMFAMFPLVLGIMGASNPDLVEQEGLLMPICQLVFATVEMVVAAWSIGVCSQALCCPNTTFSHMTGHMRSASMGVRQFMATADGHHMVLFSSAAAQPNVLYTASHPHAPIVLQNGISTMQLTSQPGLVCGITRTPPAYPQGAPQPVGITYIPQCAPEGQQEEERPVGEKNSLLERSEDCENGSESPTVPETQDGTYEVEDENVHLLC